MYKRQCLLCGGSHEGLLDHCFIKGSCEECIVVHVVDWQVAPEVGAFSILFT